MTKSEVKNRIKNNMLFGKGKESCRLLAVYLAKVNNDESEYLKPIIGCEFTIKKKNDKFELINTEVGLEKYCNTDDYTKSSYINFGECMKINNMHCDMNVKIIYKDKEEANIINYYYNTKFITQDGYINDVIELSAMYDTQDEDKENKPILMIIALPMSKMVPIVMHISYDLSNEIDIRGKINSLIENYLDKDIDEILNGDNENIVFNSYKEPFDTKSYQIKYSKSYKDIKHTPIEDKIDELKYLEFDEFDETIEDKVIYKNKKTNIGYESWSKNNTDYMVHTIDDVILSKYTYNYDGYADVLREGKLDSNNNSRISYYDYGYTCADYKGYDKINHMSRITDENFFTENEMKFIDMLDFIKIDYDNEYPRARQIIDYETYNPDDEVPYYGNLYPYRWVDADNLSTNNDRVIELFGIFEKEDGGTANVSALILNEKIMVLSSGYMEGTVAHNMIEIHRIDDEDPVYTCHKTIENSLYANNTITECDLGDGFKFRITERINTDMSNNITGNLYSYESPELNIIIDRFKNKILSFESSIYNRYFDDYVYIRDIYGCQEKLNISDLER